VQYGFGLHFEGDFLARTEAPTGCNVIATNPPYLKAAAFAQHAITLVPDVFLLLRLAFLESVSRTELLEARGLCTVYPFRRRLPRMHRSGWQGRRSHGRSTWWLNGKAVPPNVAASVIAKSEIVGAGDGLFPDTPQTYQSTWAADD
jgi:hypothetical protein